MPNAFSYMICLLGAYWGGGGGGGGRHPMDVHGYRGGGKRKGRLVKLCQHSAQLKLTIVYPHDAGVAYQHACIQQILEQQ